MPDFSTFNPSHAFTATALPPPPVHPGNNGTDGVAKLITTGVAGVRLLQAQDRTVDLATADKLSIIWDDDSFEVLDKTGGPLLISGSGTIAGPPCSGFNYFDDLTDWQFEGVSTEAKLIKSIEVQGGSVAWGSEVVEQCAVSPGQHSYIPSPTLIAIQLNTSSGVISPWVYHGALAITGNAFELQWTDTKFYFSDVTNTTQARFSLVQSATATLNLGCVTPVTPMGSARYQPALLSAADRIKTITRIEMLDSIGSVIFGTNVAFQCATAPTDVYFPV